MFPFSPSTILAMPISLRILSRKKKFLWRVHSMSLRSWRKSLAPCAAWGIGAGEIFEPAKLATDADTLVVLIGKIKKCPIKDALNGISLGDACKSSTVRIFSGLV
jgi:hypothetical protein